MAETQSFIDKSVGEWLRRLECASLLYRYSLDGATLFPNLILKKLCRSVHNEVTLILAKYRADLTIISNTDHKTKWPRFWLTR